jgi:hypothetical protein
MKVLGIVLVWLGAMWLLFTLHWLIGAGALCLSIHSVWQWKKERDFVRRALAPGAGLTYQPPADDRETRRRRALGYDS